MSILRQAAGTPRPAPRTFGRSKTQRAAAPARPAIGDERTATIAAAVELEKPTTPSYALSKWLAQPEGAPGHFQSNIEYRQFSAEKRSPYVLTRSSAGLTKRDDILNSVGGWADTAVMNERCGYATELRLEEEYHGSADARKGA